MADTVTCPECGAQSYDHEWCDVCGAEIPARDAEVLPWLDVGSVLTFTLGGVTRHVRVIETVEAYATRRVTLGRLAPESEHGGHFTEEELARPNAPAPASFDVAMVPTNWRLLMLEESVKEENLEPDAIKPEVRHLVHLPFVTVRRGKTRAVDLMDAPAGAPLQDYLESLGRLLTIEEAAGVTLLLMDAVETVHNANLYHFQICPWTIRIAHAEGDEGRPATEEALKLSFEGIRGFYNAGSDIDSHPVIMGFSPPEFFGRNQGDIDRRVDIFGIGMLFYYLLAGCPPPTGGLTRYIPLLPVRAYRFEIPPGLQPFVDGCCAPRPVDRYATVAAARTALLEALDIAHRRSIDRVQPSESQGRKVSLYAAVDRHIGIGKGRRNPINQDAVFLGHDPVRGISLIAVADGVSTSSFGSGDIASAFLVDSTAKAWEGRHLLKRGEGDGHKTMPDKKVPDLMLADLEESEPADESANGGTTQGRVALSGSRSNSPVLNTAPAKLLKRILQDANSSVSDYINKRYAPFSGMVHEVMGTTALLAYFDDDIVTLASLGDSRIYLLRDKKMELLTRDHNLSTLHIIEGFSADDALSLPHGKALARCLGTFHVREGHLVSVAPEPDLCTFRVLPGDTLLITSDGLVDFAGPTEAAAEATIRDVLLQEEIPSLACLRLILTANEGGGEDNIGVAVIRVTDYHSNMDRMSITQVFPPARRHIEGI